MKEFLHSLEYEGIWRALQNEGGDKGGRCGAFSLIRILQEADEVASADGLSPPSSSARTSWHHRRAHLLRSARQQAGGCGREQPELRKKACDAG
jgi:hypothetical protein